MHAFILHPAPILTLFGARAAPGRQCVSEYEYQLLVRTGVLMSSGFNSMIKSVCVLLLQDLLQSCSRGGGERVEDMCNERRRAEACVDESAHHALVNAGGREIV